MSVIDWNGEARNILKAVRAVGYLEGMSATLWRLAGPEIADEAIVDYDKSVATSPRSWDWRRGTMTDGYLLNLRTFREVRDDKAQALKPLEEAAEVFGAWQELDSMRRSPFFSAWRDMRDDLIDEFLDTVQATVNLLAAVGATQGEVDDAIRRMDERNGSRGRL